MAPAPTVDGLTGAVKKSELLVLQTSARELHSDLFKPGTGLPEAAADGKLATQLFQLSC